MNANDIKDMLRVLQEPSVKALMQSSEFIDSACQAGAQQPAQAAEAGSQSPEANRVLQNPMLVHKIAVLYSKLHGYAGPS